MKKEGDNKVCSEGKNKRKKINEEELNQMKAGKDFKK